MENKKEKLSSGLTIIQVPEEHPIVHSNHIAKNEEEFYRMSPLEVYNRAKAGLDYPVKAETLPIEFGLNNSQQLRAYLPEKEPGVHRVEFIIWKAYWICNVEIDGVWHHSSFPNFTNMAEFLAEGQIHNAIKWPVGRRYTNE